MYVYIEWVKISFKKEKEKKDWVSLLWLFGQKPLLHWHICIHMQVYIMLCVILYCYFDMIETAFMILKIQPVNQASIN